MDVLDDGSIVCVLADFSMSAVTRQDKLAVPAFKQSSFRGLSVSYAAPEILEKYISDNSSSRVTTQSRISSKNQRHSILSVEDGAADAYAFAILSFEFLIRALSS